MVSAMTDVVNAPRPVEKRQGSPRITDNDRKILLEMLEGDDFEALNLAIVTEDFGSNTL